VQAGLLRISHVAEISSANFTCTLRTTAETTTLGTDLSGDEVFAVVLFSTRQNADMLALVDRLGRFSQLSQQIAAIQRQSGLLISNELL
jgi:hypothetical protein